jgi:hypothetical protein
LEKDLEVNRVLVRERISAMSAICFYGLLNICTGELLYLQCWP